MTLVMVVAGSSALAFMLMFLIALIEDGHREPMRRFIEFEQQHLAPVRPKAHKEEKKEECAA